MHNRTRLIAGLGALVVALAVGACGSSHTARVTPAARLISTPGNSAGKIVLSSVGAQRIGLTTSTARRVPQVKVHRGAHKSGSASHVASGSTVIIPSSAVIYDPSGKTYAFISVGHLTFTEVPVAVNYMSGNLAYLRNGPHAGSKVVSTGAEELYGVQTGVLGQT
jgi:hypothetical protein